MRFFARFFQILLATFGALFAISCSSESTPVQVTDTHNHAAKPTDETKAAQAGINQTPPPGPAPEGMVWIPGGTFWMGCDDCNMPDAEPVHLVYVDGYWMDKTPVTNAQFAKFVAATGYKTIAEQTPDPKDFPGVPLDKLVAGSAIFNPPKKAVPLDNAYVWWRYQPGASWKTPEGPGSSIKGREDHPVVHIAWLDAVEYAKWAGKRLPTEAEFEFGARGGLDRNKFAWGNELKPNGKWAANIWQGKFPEADSGEDGYKTVTSPVTAFPPNGFGLYDVGGNVWQWCADWYRPDYFEKVAAKEAVKNPQGPSDSYDPQEPGVPKRVQKSGSLMCSDQYCARYHVGSRGKGAMDSGASHVGFRCVKSAS
ncbi:MAG TPA: formylglycine-generating enzyme family protein [Blastocatellia bacterium]|nr:formylglycine-generating enzyme family protein [Blastocatellia bacterium]